MRGAKHNRSGLGGGPPPAPPPLGVWEQRLAGAGMSQAKAVLLLHQMTPLFSTCTPTGRGCFRRKGGAPLKGGDIDCHDQACGAEGASSAVSSRPFPSRGGISPHGGKPSVAWLEPYARRLARTVLLGIKGGNSLGFTSQQRVAGSNPAGG